MCDPDHFLQFRVQAASDHIEVKPEVDSEDDGCIRPVRKSNVKPLKVTEEVVEVRKELYEWRRCKAEACFGADLVVRYGSHLLMPNSMINRIVACSKAGKMPNLMALVIETGWRQDLADQYGESLLATIHKHYPHQKTSVPRSQKLAKKPGSIDAVETNMMVSTSAFPETVLGLMSNVAKGLCSAFTSGICSTASGSCNSFLKQLKYGGPYLIKSRRNA